MNVPVPPWSWWRTDAKLLLFTFLGTNLLNRAPKFRVFPVLFWWVAVYKFRLYYATNLNPVMNDTGLERRDGQRYLVAECAVKKRG